MSHTLVVAGDCDGALRVFDAILTETAELADLTESEYGFLLHVLGEKNRFEDLQRVWLHMKEDLGGLTPVALSLVEQYFTKHAGVKEDGSPKWHVSTVQVDPKVGSFRCCACAVLHHKMHAVGWFAGDKSNSKPDQDTLKQTHESTNYLNPPER